MKKIGIFLAFAPEQPIKNHGIGRLLTFMLGGMLQDESASIVIATPAWYKKAIIAFLTEHDIDVKRIELLTTTGIPYLLRIQKLFTSSKTTRTEPAIQQKVAGKIDRILNKIVHKLFNLFIGWMSLSSTPLFFGIGFLLVVLGIFFSPLILAALAFLASRSFFTRIYNWLRYRVIRRVFGIISNNRFIHRINTFFSDPLKELRRNMMAQKIYSELRVRELRRLTDLINKRADITTWFVPSLFWPEVGAIHAKKVVAAPDAVFVDFPSEFSDRSSALAFNRTAETIAVADHFICYSDYVKEKHLIDSFAIEAEKITVIPHGAIDLSHYFGKNSAKKTGISRRDEALQILRDYQKQSLQNDSYLCDYDFSSMRYIFYSSQMRPYKNILKLVQAYETLLRKRFVNIKLVLTADITSDYTVYEYVLRKRLQFDVILLPNVPGKVLAALNHLAICAINPSLFEGGFPFTFTEAYSVGTPSIMSGISVVTSAIEDIELQKNMLFDPYNLDDMVNKIEWAVKNRDTLFKLQETLYQQFNQRTWRIVAKEYVNLLTHFTVQYA
ncbi:MAG: glycosyltransferase [Gammaproteobacteria bacterium]